jgi:hypothetical protein
MTRPDDLAHHMEPRSRTQPVLDFAGRSTLGDTVRLASRIAGALTLAVFAIGLAVALTFSAEARSWLAYPFAGVPAQPAEGGSIFLHNLRALVAVAGLLLVAQSAYWGVPSRPGLTYRAVQRAGEALLAAAVAANVLVVGVSLGAYETRMVRAMLPHGPFELASYSLALALYIQGRHRPLPLRQAITVLVLAAAALALAAVLETFG